MPTEPAVRPRAPVIPLSSPEELRRAIASVLPFRGWPDAALQRLGQSSRAARYAAGAAVVSARAAVAALTIVVRGEVQASVTDAEGRRVVFKVDGGYSVYGLLPLLDGGPMPSDLLAVGPVTALAVPYSAIRAELARAPELWESVALEAGTRARTYTLQMKRFLFDAPRVRMSAVLVSHFTTAKGQGEGAARTELRLSQAQMGEMLGISRQWTTQLVREMTREGLIEWRYGRIKVLDIDRLRAIAARSINEGALDAGTRAGGTAPGRQQVARTPARDR